LRRERVNPKTKRRSAPNRRSRITSKKVIHLARRPVGAHRFVISPDAVKPGTVALKEVDFAASLNKRFAPIVFRPVEDKSVPEALAKLNFIFFDDDARFEQSADQLIEALNTDITWIRQHTEFGEAARRWALAKGPISSRRRRNHRGQPRSPRRRENSNQVSPNWVPRT
jgi:hypothetical protein